MERKFESILESNGSCDTEAECEPRRECDLLELVVGQITNALVNSYPEKQNLERALVELLKYDFGRWTEEYLNGELELIAQRFNHEFDLNISPDYMHATHAKMASMATAIKDKYEGGKKKKKKK